MVLYTGVLMTNKMLQVITIDPLSIVILILLGCIQDLCHVIYELFI